LVFRFLLIIMILSNDWFSRQYFDKIEISFYLRTSWISTYLSIKAFISTLSNLTKTQDKLRYSGRVIISYSNSGTRGITHGDIIQGPRIFQITGNKGFNTQIRRNPTCSQIKRYFNFIKILTWKSIVW
jgi:hypothetical protein